MEDFEINMSFEFDMIPPPDDDTREPCLFLFVKVLERNTGKTLAQIYYARSRHYLHGGLMPNREDRFEILSQVRSRIREDFSKHLRETGVTTKVAPVYLNNHET